MLLCNVYDLEGKTNLIDAFVSSDQLTRADCQVLQGIDQFVQAGVGGQPVDPVALELGEYQLRLTRSSLAWPTARGKLIRLDMSECMTIDSIDNLRDGNLSRFFQGARRRYLTSAVIANGSKHSANVDLT
jgi:hypothetical protein